MKYIVEWRYKDDDDWNQVARFDSLEESRIYLHDKQFSSADKWYRCRESIDEEDSEPFYIFEDLNREMQRTFKALPDEKPGTIGYSNVLNQLEVLVNSYEKMSVVVEKSETSKKEPKWNSQHIGNVTSIEKTEDGLTIKGVAARYDPLAPLRDFPYPIMVKHLADMDDPPIHNPSGGGVYLIGPPMYDKEDDRPLIGVYIIKPEQFDNALNVIFESGSVKIPNEGDRPGRWHHTGVSE